MEADDRNGRPVALGSSTPRPGASTKAPASSKGSGTTTASGRRTPGTADSSATVAESPKPQAYPLLWLDEKQSLDIKEPVDRDDAKGDIRFVCGSVTCALESDTSVIGMLYTDKPGATLDSCRIALGVASSHRLSLAATAAGSGIRPFWKAVLGYADEAGAEGPEDPLVDPVRQGPAVWFQQMDRARSQRNRIHIDISVPHDEAPRRIEAALAAGGRLVSATRAPAFWVLADLEGNEACVTTWQGRDG
jgi:hypothetical protein